MGSRFIDVTDERGEPDRIIESRSAIDTSHLNVRGSLSGMATYSTQDGETLNRNGDTFVGIHSGRRFIVA